MLTTAALSPLLPPSNMKVGGKRTILVPASLGYGATGSRAVPPNSGLVFEITLNKVE